LRFQKSDTDSDPVKNRPDPQQCDKWPCLTKIIGWQRGVSKNCEISLFVTTRLGAA
jgi:hypothetical protein